MQAAPIHEPDTGGFEQAEALEALVVEEAERPHQQEVEDLVLMADFLAPELHRAGSSDDAAEAITEWADGDPDLLTEAETVARREHNDESAELLHEAVEAAESDGP